MIEDGTAVIAFHPVQGTVGNVKSLHNGSTALVVKVLVEKLHEACVSVAARCIVVYEWRFGVVHNLILILQDTENLWNDETLMVPCIV